MQWYNEPSSWEERDGRITVRSDGKTDFWRKTHNGAINDNGHFYYQEVAGSFTVEVKVSGCYADLYDQAGVMLRIDEANWLKCGIELFNGVQQASAVCTREFSDWSILPLADPDAIWLKVVYRDGSVEVSYALDGESFTMIRQAYLGRADSVQAGIMIAAPTGGGFEAEFDGFRVAGI